MLNNIDRSIQHCINTKSRQLSSYQYNSIALALRPAIQLLAVQYCIDAERRRSGRPARPATSRHPASLAWKTIDLNHMSGVGFVVVTRSSVAQPPPPTYPPADPRTRRQQGSRLHVHSACHPPYCIAIAMTLHTPVQAVCLAAKTSIHSSDQYDNAMNCMEVGLSHSKALTFIMPSNNVCLAHSASLA